jgi:hypothetical protein
MVGGRMVGSCCEVKRGTRTVQGSEVHGWREPEEAHTGGVRILVVAKKSRNWDGAKGDRKEEA